MSAYKFKAHPTIYAGTRFRSRLEARWAAFFDLAGWRWEYEPHDLSGWVPDFILLGEAGATPVEIKPIEWDPGGTLSPADEALARPDLLKARRHPGEVLVLGAYLPTHMGCGMGPALGALLNECWSQDVDWKPGDHADTAVLAEGRGPVFDFHAEFGSYHYRIGGQYDGDHHLLECSHRTAMMTWRKAGNAVQWRGH